MEWHPLRQPVSNLIPVVGRWDAGETDGIVTYNGPRDGQAQPFGICVSKFRLTNGDATTLVRFPTSAGPLDSAARLIVGYQPERYLSIGIGGYGYAFVIDQFDVARGWRALRATGVPENLQRDRDYKLTVRVRGQKVSLEVDDIPVLETALESPIPDGQLGLFTWGPAPVQFRQTQLVQAQGTLFVAMPLRDPYFELHNEVIQASAKAVDLHAYHGGEIYGPGVILKDVVDSILTCQVVAAEITEPNPNVYYELGYAHALNKPTILLVEERARKCLPFDISGYRCLFYENTIGGKRKIEETLTAHLRAVLRLDPPA
jgi:hypothetical protein